ncbi:MAG: gamma-glutamylcyclotransferase [Rhodospirillaceae bacterium]|jgi:glutathione-specific gamma-glutamylcyclotransferase|nr:gamma-glutamylcyclotransferase [Rhodospirillaceae bacterium]MBT6138190.1 gamma-glutamylcyclotransferase [Rhodospirillaceae bacterium]
MTEPTPHVLTRESIRSSRIRDMIRARGEDHVLSDQELIDTRLDMFPGRRIDSDVWVFGYGSLIWNPVFHYVEKRAGIVHGYHRRFCMWTNLGRGSDEAPGLMLGLDRGGSCRGMAFRIAAEVADEELDLIWNREMMSDTYRPTWMTVRTETGPVRAISFVMRRDHRRYIGPMGDDEAAASIAKASGFLGPCREYLFNTVDHLEELGIPDKGLTRLRNLVLKHLDDQHD